MRITKIIFLLFNLLLLCCGCNENEDGQIDCEVWVEMYPEQFDGVSDTIVFGRDHLVYKHFYFNGWNYSKTIDSLIFTNGSIVKKYSFCAIGVDEIVINNFIDRTLNNQVKDIFFRRP